jgi:hypothetical protein
VCEGSWGRIEQQQRRRRRQQRKQGGQLWVMPEQTLTALLATNKSHKAVLFVVHLFVEHGGMQTTSDVKGVTS